MEVSKIPEVEKAWRLGTLVSSGNWEGSEVGNFHTSENYKPSFPTETSKLSKLLNFRTYPTSKLLMLSTCRAYDMPPPLTVPVAFSTCRVNDMPRFCWHFRRAGCIARRLFVPLRAILSQSGRSRGSRCIIFRRYAAYLLSPRGSLSIT